MQTLVLIPGLGSDGAVWRRTVVALGGRVECLIGDTLSDDTLAGWPVASWTRRRNASLSQASRWGMVALELMRLAPERISHLALIDTNTLPDTPGRKLYRRLANLAVGSARDFGRQAERSLGTLVHPNASEDVRAELVGMSVRHPLYPAIRNIRRRGKACATPAGLRCRTGEGRMRSMNAVKHNFPLNKLGET